MRLFPHQHRVVKFVLLLLASWAVARAHARWAGEVPHIDYLTGWALLAVILVLTLFNGQKKVPFLPLCSSGAWLQFHIYAGLFTGALFAIHVNYKMPAGWFQGVLASLYALVMASGIFGLLVSRAIPRRLTTRGGEVLFERIPSVRRQLRDQAQKLALQSVGESHSPAIADFYARDLANFFCGANNFFSHLLKMEGPLTRMVGKIHDLNRYLSQSERVTMEQIENLVRQKDGLDYHYAHQFALKAWLFTHIPLTYGLLLFTGAHIVIVCAFSGGAS